MSPDKRQHRGAHPDDRRLFAADQLASLRAATGELSWLLSRGYALSSSLKLVGDRHNLNERQRLAISRAACTDMSRERRKETRVAIEKIQREHLIVDGFNLIITIEAALGSGVIMVCRDGCLRDLSSVHGSYRSVQETDRAICLIGETLEPFGPASVEWLLDRPISNSGRLAQRIRECAIARGWPWSVEVAFNPDTDIIASDKIAVTSDSTVLDGATRWINLNACILERHLPQSWIIDLSSDCE